MVQQQKQVQDGLGILPASMCERLGGRKIGCDENMSVTALA